MMGFVGNCVPFLFETDQVGAFVLGVLRIKWTDAEASHTQALDIVP
jgi:hypothetical protein